VAVTQCSLFDAGESARPRTPGSAAPREWLDGGAWVEFESHWLGGSAHLFDRLLGEVPWRAERRRMYDRTVDVPRLVAFYREEDPLPDPVLVEVRDSLCRMYKDERAAPFSTAGICLYRTGDDSVAWHGDRIGRRSHDETLVAIVSLGAPRRLLLRPKGGGQGRRFSLGHGDLLVMGGTCQRTWEHSVPKTARAAGPRISVQFRSAGAG